MPNRFIMPMHLWLLLLDRADLCKRTGLMNRPYDYQRKDCTGVYKNDNFLLFLRKTLHLFCANRSSIWALRISQNIGFSICA